MEDNTNIDLMVSETEKWIQGNEFGAYNGSLRSLVAWVAKTDRRFEWVSMVEVDEATTILTKKLAYKPVKIRKSNTTESNIPTGSCYICGTSLIGTKYDRKMKDLCKNCFESVKAHAIDLLEESEIVRKID